MLKQIKNQTDKILGREVKTVIITNIRKSSYLGKDTMFIDFRCKGEGQVHGYPGGLYNPELKPGFAIRTETKWKAFEGKGEDTVKAVFVNSEPVVLEEE